MVRRRRKTIAVVIVLAIFVLLSLPPVASRFAKTRAGSVLHPVSAALSAVGRKLGQIWSVTFHSENIVSQKQNLQTEVEILHAEKAILEEKLYGFVSLHEQINALEGSGFKVLPASVIAWDPEIWYGTVLINRGARDGIRRGSLAVVGEKLAGRTIEVGGRWSRIRLLTDLDSVVPALVQRKRVKGIVLTTEKGILKMDYLEDAKNLEVGDVVITSEANHRYETEQIIFPQGLIIGEISEIILEERGWYSARIEPAIDFRKLEKLFVIIEE